MEILGAIAKATYTALVATYGLRPELGLNGHRVPYTPADVARKLMDVSWGVVDAWHDANIPNAAKQPQFMANRLHEMRSIVGRHIEVHGAFLFNPKSMEPAKGAVAQLKPGVFTNDITVNHAPSLILNSKASFDFWFAVQKLALQTDALSGVPTKFDLAVAATEEAAQDVVNKAKDATTWLGKIGVSSLFLYAGIAAMGFVLMRGNRTVRVEYAAPRARKRKR